MTEQQDLDRNEAATPFKLQKARERGQVGKSTDVVAALVFTVAATYFYWRGWNGLVEQLSAVHDLLTQAGRVDGSLPALWQVIEGFLRHAMEAVLPFMAALMLTAIVATLIQTGAVLSIEPIKPDWSRPNPVTGFKRLFAMRTLFEAGRAVLKLMLLSLVAWQVLMDLAPRFLQVANLPAPTLARTLIDVAGGAGLKMAAVLCLIAAIDYGYMHREFARKMRMSRREMKDETKHREGDPRIRARLRQLRREAFLRTMALRKASSADVVLTNPTHVAVALRYDQGEMSAPQVVAKGAGALAAIIRKIAARHSIPVVQNPPLARALYRQAEVEQQVPPALYAQVARILVWVYAMRKARDGAAVNGVLA